MSSKENTQATAGQAGPIVWRCPYCNTTIRDRHYRSVSLQKWIRPRADAHLYAHANGMTEPLDPNELDTFLNNYET